MEGNHVGGGEKETLSKRETVPTQGVALWMNPLLLDIQGDEGGSGTVTWELPVSGDLDKSQHLAAGERRGWNADGRDGGWRQLCDTLCSSES